MSVQNIGLNDDQFNLFINNLLVDLGLNKESKEEQEKYLAKIANIVNNRIMSLIMVYLDPAKADEFLQILETGDKQKISDYVHQMIPDFDNKVFNELVILEKELKVKNNDSK